MADSEVVPLAIASEDGAGHAHLEEFQTASPTRAWRGTLAREAKEWAADAFTLSTLLSFVPITQWVPKYVARNGHWRQQLQGDIVAGLTVGVMVVPQGMAYALLAQMPPVYGLYSTVTTMAIYVIFGSSRELSVAPVAVNSLLLASSLVTLADPVTQQAQYINYVFTTTFLIGVLSAALGVARLGAVVGFISPAVIAGFTSASAVQIALSQLEPLLGYSSQRNDYLVPQLINTFSAIRNTKWLNLVIGLGSILILYAMKFSKNKWVKLVPRPLFVTVAMTLLSWGLYRAEVNKTYPFNIVGNVPPGLPAFMVPDLSASTISTVLPAAFLLTILGFMQSISVSLKYAQQRHYAVDASQELLALGLAHTFASFFQSFDATGGFSRTAVNVSSGARSQVASAITVVVMIISLVALTPLFYYIPKATLAAIIIAAVLPLIEPSQYLEMWRVKRRDAVVGVITGLVTLFASIQIGLGVGVGISLLLIVRNSSRPHTAVLGKVKGEDVVYRNVLRYPDAQQFPGVLIWRFDADLWFANVNFFQQQVLATITGASPKVPTVSRAKTLARSAASLPKPAPDADAKGPADVAVQVDSPAPASASNPSLLRVLVLSMSSVNDMDYAGAGALLSTVALVERDFGVRTLFAEVKGPVRDVLWRATKGRIRGVGDAGEGGGAFALERGQFFMTVSDAVERARNMAKEAPESA